jgi:hypothetical protein
MSIKAAIEAARLHLLGHRRLILRQRALVEELVDVAHHVVGDDRVAFGGGVEGAAVESGIGRLQVVERELRNYGITVTVHLILGITNYGDTNFGDSAFNRNYGNYGDSAFN